MQKLRCAVIGLNMGLNHVNAYLECPDAELVAVCDCDAAWLKHVQHEKGVSKAYTDYHDLLADPTIDIISNCLPTYLHASTTIEALHAGKHVLCEKPMAVNAREAEAMVAAAKVSGKKLMVSQNQRFTQKAQYLRKCVDEGFFGEIYFARVSWMRPMGGLPSPKATRATGEYDRNWFNQCEKGGGVLRDLGSHMLDLSLWLMGFPAFEKAISANLSVFAPPFAHSLGVEADAEDFASGLLRFANGSAIQLTTCFVSHSDADRLQYDFYGTKGGARFSNQSNLSMYTRMNGAYTAIDPINIDSPEGMTQSHFVCSVRDNSEPLVTGAQGVRVIETLDALYADGISQRICE